MSYCFDHEVEECSCEQDVVDQAIIKIFKEPGISKEIKLTFLELLALLNKEKKPIGEPIQEAAAHCALGSFAGDLNEPIPAIAL
jgi:FKBP12-rapamycin complex-associated protein